jgi:hypothetical protein
MRTSAFSAEHIVGILKEQELGTELANLCPWLCQPRPFVALAHHSQGT